MKSYEMQRRNRIAKTKPKKNRRKVNFNGEYWKRNDNHKAKLVKLYKFEVIDCDGEPK